MIDCVIPSKPSDYNKLPYVIGSIARYVPQVGSVHVVGPANLGFDSMDGVSVYCHTDESVLDFDRSRFRWRPNWVFQQFIKLFQNVTDTDLYLVVDADIMFNKHIDIHDGLKPVLMLARDQNHGAYFEFNMRMMGFGRVYDHSFLSECTVYSKSLVCDMVRSAGLGSSMDFVMYAASVIDSNCYPAESELYGNFVMKHHPDFYTIRHVRSSMQGRYGGHVWTDDEIRSLIDEMKNREDVDIFSMHTWDGSL